MLNRLNLLTILLGVDAVSTPNANAQLKDPGEEAKAKAEAETRLAQLATKKAAERTKAAAKRSPLNEGCSKCQARPGEECDMRANPSHHRFHAARVKQAGGSL